MRAIYSDVITFMFSTDKQRTVDAIKGRNDMEIVLFLNLWLVFGIVFCWKVSPCISSSTWRLVCRWFWPCVHRLFLGPNVIWGAGDKNHSLDYPSGEGMPSLYSVLWSDHKSITNVLEPEIWFKNYISVCNIFIVLHKNASNHC